MGCVQSSEEARVSPETIDIEKQPNEPEGLTKDRTCTDIVFLILLGIFVIVLVGLLIYCVIFSDIYRLINGYDDCGNVCGRKNFRQEGMGCSGADRSKEKFLLVNSAPSTTNLGAVYRTCVESCENRAGYTQFINRCLPVSQQSATNSQSKSFFSKTGIQDFFQEVSEDLQASYKEIIYLGLLSLAFSIILMFALRYISGLIVWIILIGVVAALISGTVSLWVYYAEYIADEKNNENLGQEKKSSYLACAILVTIATVCICLIIFALRKRISLVIQLFKEAGKAVASMPMLLIEPILTFLALAFFIALWLYFALVIESSGKLEKENNQSVHYEKSTVILVTRWYNLFALFWFVNFAIGCQHMVVAGAVATWFFTRNKSKLSAPIITSFRNLTRYHLGTVAIGSLLIAVLNLLRAMLKSLSYSLNNPQNRLCQCLHTACMCCLCIFEKFLQFLTRNAYIETALNGEPFCKAGKKAFYILSSNALRVFAINSVGDFVLLLSKALVVLCTVLVGIELIQKKEGLLHSWVPLVLGGLFAYLIAHCFISVYEMTIDTIFICFCEDCEQNDGINKPYYMSRGLMEFVQNSKKALHVYEEKSGKEAWSGDKSANGK